MRHFRWIGAVMVICLGLSLPCQAAQRPGRLLWRLRTVPSTRSIDGYDAFRADNRYGPYAHDGSLYPRYYGGIHARELQRAGIPSGDIGPRGNGIYWTPW